MPPSLRHCPVNLLDLPPITVLMGHAGVGKTNCALGLALSAAGRGQRITLADLDTVNPYFRSSDYTRELEGRGVHVIAPYFAGTTLDTPSLTGELDVAISRVAKETIPTRESITAHEAHSADDALELPEAIWRGPRQPERLIIDCGGDDDGATTLGRYSAALREARAYVLYVVSAYRSLTLTPTEAAAMLPAMERNSRLRATAILNTSNLAGETTIAHVQHGRAFAAQAARLLGIPLAATAVPSAALASLADEKPSLAGEAAALLAPEGHVKPGGRRLPVVRELDLSSFPQIAALLTDGPSQHEQLLVMPRFVVTPWDAIA